MGYRTSSIEIVAGELRIARATLARFEKKTLIAFSANAGPSALVACGLNEWRITRMPSGECGLSGEEEILTLLALTTGAADVVVTWEGGDSFSGYRVKDGEVEACNVSFALTPKGEDDDADA